MKTKDKFFLQGSAQDPAYKNVRDLNHFSDARMFVEKLWTAYEPLADNHFKVDAKAHFMQRFWEMYLGVTLQQHWYKLYNSGDKGPEFYMVNNSQKIWIEAISPGPGSGPDAVPGFKYGEVQNEPEKEIILRLTHAIEEKHRAYLNYSNDDIIHSNDAYIIAINGGRIQSLMVDSDLPYIIKTVFPFGHLAAVFDKKENKITDSYHLYRDNISKKSGEQISTKIFYDPKYKGISGVLYSTVDPVNKPKIMGDDFVFVHNPTAENKLPLGMFQFGKEYWDDKDYLNCKVWS